MRAHPLVPASIARRSPRRPPGRAGPGHATARRSVRSPLRRLAVAVALATLLASPSGARDEPPPVAPAPPSPAAKGTAATPPRAARKPKPAKTGPAAAEHAPAADAPPSTADASAPPKQAATADERIAQLQRDVEQLRGQLADEGDRVAQLEDDLSAQKERVSALESELADARAQRRQRARASVGRDQDLAALASRLAEAERALAAGSGDLGDALARAASTAAQVAASASAAGASEQAALAQDAQRWIAAAQDAVGRSDLFQARAALQGAAADAVRARALASSAPAD